MTGKQRKHILVALAVCTCFVAASAQRDAATNATAVAAKSRYELINTRPGNVLVLILTDCANYSDWQTLAAAFAWRQSGQPGSVVRVANCNEKDTKSYDKNMLAYVKTHMAPQFGWNEELQDWYAAYNKPGAVLDYFKHNSPPEEWVVVLDSDMLLRKPFLSAELPLDKGWAYAGHYSYLIGTDNDLARRHVPEVTPRNDTKAGPVGRRGDRVGGPYFMHRDDLHRLAPQWLNYSKIVRGDKQAYKDSGDEASKPGERIWIAEMYGYSFGAAKSDIWHMWREDFVVYPSYEPHGIPYVLHYGLVFDVGGWRFDKHSYFDFDSRKCPPWELDTARPTAGIFPPPPSPEELQAKDLETRYRDVLAVSVIAMVNAALCDYHVRNCPPSPQLTQVCNKAFKLWYEVDQEIKELEWKYNCTDHNDQCSWWASQGECGGKQKAFMADHCRVSCKYCVLNTPLGSRPNTGPNDAAPMSVEELSEFVGKKAAAASGRMLEQPPRPQPPPIPSPLLQPSQPAAKPAEQSTSAVSSMHSNGRQQKPSSVEVEAEMHQKYATSDLSYAALIKRCSNLPSLTDQQMRDCVKAASVKLKYPSTAADASLKSLASAAAATKAANMQQASSATTGATGRQIKLNADMASTHDLASLHALHSGLLPATYEPGSASPLSGPDNSWSVVNEAVTVLLIVFVGLAVYTSLRRRYSSYKSMTAKAHGRSE